MVILKCDKCYKTEEIGHERPKYIPDPENPGDYHRYWLIMVAGSGSYLKTFPTEEFFIEELGVNLCNMCLDDWKRHKANQQPKIKEAYQDFLEPNNASNH